MIVHVGLDPNLIVLRLVRIVLWREAKSRRIGTSGPITRRKPSIHHQVRRHFEPWGNKIGKGIGVRLYRWRAEIPLISARLHDSTLAPAKLDIEPFAQPPC